jgi:hypothetical protein
VIQGSTTKREGRNTGQEERHMIKIKTETKTEEGNCKKIKNKRTGRRKRGLNL